MSRTFKNGKKLWEQKLVDAYRRASLGSLLTIRTHETPQFWGREVQWSAHHWREGCGSKDQGHRDTAVGQFPFPQLTQRRPGEPRASWKACPNSLLSPPSPPLLVRTFLGIKASTYQCNDLSPQRSPYWPYIIGRPETDEWVSRAQMSAIQRNILVLESPSGPGSDSGRSIQSGRSLEAP